VSCSLRNADSYSNFTWLREGKALIDDKYSISSSVDDGNRVSVLTIKQLGMCEVFCSVFFLTYFIRALSHPI